MAKRRFGSSRSTAANRNAPTRRRRGWSPRHKEKSGWRSCASCSMEQRCPTTSPRRNRRPALRRPAQLPQGREVEQRWAARRGAIQPIMFVHGETCSLRNAPARALLERVACQASSKGPHRHVLIERHIDQYLRTDPVSLRHALEQLRTAIRYEELQRREDEDWSDAREYVRTLLRRMT